MSADAASWGKPAALGLLVFVSFLTLVPCADAAQSRSVRFQHISQNDGLSQSFVFTIVQDEQGFMWFGTQDGLNRFDGIGFTVFANEPGDPGTISDNTIRTMISDRSGQLWVGTDAGGLSRFDYSSQSFTNYLHDASDPASISDNRVRVVYEDRAGALWVGTDGSGLDRFDRESGTFAHFTHAPDDPDSLAGDHVWDIVEDAGGNLWIATTTGLSRWDSSRRSFTNYRADPNDPTSLNDDRVRVIYEDTDGVLWIGTEDGGLNRFDRGSETFEHYRHDPDDSASISSNRISTIYQDRSGVLWIGTINGLNAWNPVSGTFDRYLNNPSDRFSLAHNSVMAMYQDRGDVLWVGTYEGVSRWTPTTRNMRHYRHDAADPTSLSQNTVTSFAEGPSGEIWIGTFGGGLNALDRSTDLISHMRHRPDDRLSLSSDRVMALGVDSDGVLWAGTQTEGLNRYESETGKFDRFRHDPDDPTSISADGITFILETRDRTLWIATFGGGLNRFDRATEQFERFRSDADDPSTLSSDRLLVLFEDRQGSLWIGTYGGGLNRLDPASGKVDRFLAEPGRPDGLGGDEITMIQEDSRGDLWLGANEAGLYRWRREDHANGDLTLQRFTERNGLPNSTIYAGLWDQAGSLWLSTGRGLSRLDTESLSFRNYDTSHGLQADEFNLAAAVAAADGQLFFGGVNGFNAFRPDALAGARRPPQVAVTQISSLNEPAHVTSRYELGSILEFPHSAHVIAFDYAALDFAAPEKNRFLYRLDGFDEDWVDPGTFRRASYTNLPSGDYTFRVRAANNDGVWSETDAAVGFRMLPAPWATWWAFLLYALLTLALVYVALKQYAFRARQAERLRYADRLALAHERMNETQRIAKIGNWDWDLKNDSLWWSDEAYRLFGAEPGARPPSIDDFLQRVHPDDLVDVRAAIDRSLTDGTPLALDHRIVALDGTELVVFQQAAVTLDARDRPVRIAGTVSDITARKKNEEEIRRRAEYQELLADLSSNLIMLEPAEFEPRLRACLDIVGGRYDLDSIRVLWFVDQRKSVETVYQWSGMGYAEPQSFDRVPGTAWISDQFKHQDALVVDDMSRLPWTAVDELHRLGLRGPRSMIAIPMRIEQDLEAVCVYATHSEQRRWTRTTVAELKIIAEKLLSAISRYRASEKIGKLQHENLYLRETIRLNHSFDEIIGEDAGLRACLAAAEKVAPTEAAALILGETGTGKDLIASAIHRLSGRSDREFVRVNCPALPAPLFESELFGHERGAFTGAESRRVGRFEIADGATIFLDEVGEIPLALQSKLLRILQSGEFQRLGGSATLHCDVRLIAATNRNLEEMIEAGEFRADLYYRIATFPIRLPTLRARKSDIPLLASHFAEKHSGRLGKAVSSISPHMMRELVAYDWPGNIRELENVIERALICAGDSGVLELPGPLPLMTGEPVVVDSVFFETGASLEAVNRVHITNVLETCNWRVSGEGGAAEILGIPASTLRSKMKRLGVSRNGP